MSTKIYAAAIGLALLLYGIQEARFSSNKDYQGPKANYCGAGMCSPDIPNPEFHDEKNASTAGFQYAVKEAQQRLIGEPASPYRWEDLGESLLRVHEVDRAKYCFEQAVVAGPRNPGVLLRAINFDLAIQNYSQAIQFLRRVVDDPELAEYNVHVLRAYMNAGISRSEISADAIPKNPRVAEAFIESLRAENRVADLEAVWSWISRGLPLSSKLLNEYVVFFEQQ